MFLCRYFRVCKQLKEFITGSRREEMEDQRLRLAEVPGFSKRTLHDVKSAFVPYFFRNPTTTIYVVPKTILNVDREAYISRECSFSLFTRFESQYPLSRLKSFHAPAHVHSILSRNPARQFEDYLVAIHELKDKIRDCLLLKVEVDFQFLLAVVFSSCYILDNILNLYEGRLTPQVDQVCAAGLQYLWVDMLLLENQILFFVLKRIFDLVIVDKAAYPPLVKLCLHFFSQFLEISLHVPPMESESAHHLLHLIHYHLSPSQNPSKPLGHQRNQPFFKMLKGLLCSRPLPHLPVSQTSRKLQALTIESIPSARRLQGAGIKFKKKKSKGFSEITFLKGVLEIPHLRVDNNTRFLLRNLIAWEQCHLTIGSYFTSYAILMDYLINKANDVEILNQSGIIEESLGGEEAVASVFNGLSTNIVFTGNENNFLPHLCKELNNYCQNKVNIWWARLMTDYFGSPWTIISVVAAIILLLLTVTQTFYLAYSYHRPH